MVIRMQEGGGLDPRIPKIYNTWVLQWLFHSFVTIQGRYVFTCRYIRQKPVLVARPLVEARHNRFAGHGTRGAPCALWFVAGNRLSLHPSNIVQPRRMTMFRGDNRIFHNPSSSSRPLQRGEES